MSYKLILTSKLNLKHLTAIWIQFRKIIWSILKITFWVNNWVSLWPTLDWKQPPLGNRNHPSSSSPLEIYIINLFSWVSFLQQLGLLLKTPHGNVVIITTNTLSHCISFIGYLQHRLKICFVSNYTYEIK